jgi:hypothetical protein
VGGCDVCADTSTHPHDVWRYQALGKNREQTYQAIAAGAGTIALLEKATHYSRRTVSRHVHDLHELGLITRNKKTGAYRVVRGFDFDALAEELGADGIGARQQEKHRRQRARYAEYLEHDQFSLENWKTWSEGRKRRAIERINQQRALLLDQVT